MTCKEYFDRQECWERNQQENDETIHKKLTGQLFSNKDQVIEKLRRERYDNSKQTRAEKPQKLQRH